MGVTDQVSPDIQPGGQLWGSSKPSFSCTFSLIDSTCSALMFVAICSAIAEASLAFGSFGAVIASVNASSRAFSWFIVWALLCVSRSDGVLTSSGA